LVFQAAVIRDIRHPCRHAQVHDKTPSSPRSFTPSTPRMRILTHQLTLTTSAPIEVVDITEAVREWLQVQPVRDGLLTVRSPHTTARINLNERESALQRDMVAFLERLAPKAGDYGHNLNTVDGRDNAHAHLLGLFLNASESVAVAGGALLMGHWQSLFFIELDGPRAQRTVQLHLLGEA
jgi:secondary thiamine-phosphate synthase enzyme